MAERIARRCAVYTRKSSEEGLEQSFNSLDAQREACAAFIESQRHEGWRLAKGHYDDGGFSGGTLERPALGRLLADVEAGRIDVVVVYKVDRLTRSLADFAKIVEIFDAAGVSFVSVTQQFNTTSSMGRLTLNVLLSFAQFEREVTGERIRDKIAASKRKGMWMGGRVPLGYDLKDRKLVVNPAEAEQVRTIFRRYAELGCATTLQAELKKLGIVSKRRVSQNGRVSGGQPYSRGAVYDLLSARIYRGEIPHKGNTYPGQHEAIVDEALWEEVQSRLAANRRARRHGGTAREPSLLAGLLYDAEGYRMTPMHTMRRGRRYRYYVSQARIQQRPGPGGAPGRVGAHALEGIVINRLQKLLAAPREVLTTLAATTEEAANQKAIVARAKTLAAELPELPPAEVRALLLATVWRITLQEATLSMEIDRGHLRATLLGRTVSTRRRKGYRPQAEQLVTIHAEAKFEATRNGTALVLPPGEAESETGPSPALIKAVALAHAAYEALLAGEAKDLKSLAERFGLHRKCLQRIMPMAFLAPMIVEAILRGNPNSAAALAKVQSRLPSVWETQCLSIHDSSRAVTV